MKAVLTTNSAVAIVLMVLLLVAPARWRCCNILSKGCICLLKTYSLGSKTLYIEYNFASSLLFGDTWIYLVHLNYVHNHHSGQKLGSNGKKVVSKPKSMNILVYIPLKVCICKYSARLMSYTTYSLQLVHTNPVHIGIVKRFIIWILTLTNMKKINHVLSDLITRMVLKLCVSTRCPIQLKSVSVYICSITEHIYILYYLCTHSHIRYSEIYSLMIAYVGVIITIIIT